MTSDKTFAPIRGQAINALTGIHPDADLSLQRGASARSAKFLAYLTTSDLTFNKTFYKPTYFFTVPFICFSLKLWCRLLIYKQFLN